MGGRIDEGMPQMANEWLPERSIPDRSPGHAFIAIAHPGWGRHTKVWGAGVVIWYGELARWILPRPTPTPAGDKPLASRSLRPRYISPLPSSVDSGPVSG